ncbi:34506_t:CDS:2, partial [Racocetra persica]
KDPFCPFEISTQRTSNIGAPKMHSAKLQKSYSLMHIIDKENLNDNDLISFDNEIELLAAEPETLVINLIEQTDPVAPSIQK